MKYDEIRALPTVHDNVHESIYRSFHILEKVKELLNNYTEQDTLLELIAMMETSLPGTTEPIVFEQHHYANNHGKHPDADFFAELNNQVGKRKDIE